jgi:hypothetical protein
MPNPAYNLLRLIAILARYRFPDAVAISLIPPQISQTKILLKTNEIAVKKIEADINLLNTVREEVKLITFPLLNTLCVKIGKSVNNEQKIRITAKILARLNSECKEPRLLRPINIKINPTTSGNTSIPLVAKSSKTNKKPQNICIKDFRIIDSTPL